MIFYRNQYTIKIMPPKNWSALILEHIRLLVAWIPKITQMLVTAKDKFPSRHRQKFGRGRVENTMFASLLGDVPASLFHFFLLIKFCFKGPSPHPFTQFSHKFPLLPNRNLKVSKCKNDFQKTWTKP